MIRERWQKKLSSTAALLSAATPAHGQTTAPHRGIRFNQA